MYILVDYITQHGGFKKYLAFENFEEIKKAVIEKLDRKGWYDKDQVDLRSLRSCLYYLGADWQTIKWQKSKSLEKYIKYLYKQSQN